MSGLAPKEGEHLLNGIPGGALRAATG